ncbi:hypothetical protein CsSME_00000608 [Camellia sinensis var. sinensis]
MNPLSEETFFVSPNVEPNHLLLTPLPNLMLPS